MINYIIIGLIVMGLFFAIRSIVRNSKNGGCAGCGACNRCETKGFTCSMINIEKDN